MEGEKKEENKQESKTGLWDDLSFPGQGDNIPNHLWKRWIEADPLKRKDILRTLAFKDMIKPEFNYTFYSLLDSYLEDLMYHMRQEQNRGWAFWKPKK